MTTSFYVVRDHMYLCVSNGIQVRVGVDAILGCNDDVFLTLGIVQHLKDRGLCMLKKICNPNRRLIWNQVWMNAKEVSLVGNNGVLWDIFVA